VIRGVRIAYFADVNADVRHAGGCGEKGRVILSRRATAEEAGFHNITMEDGAAARRRPTNVHCGQRGLDSAANKTTPVVPRNFRYFIMKMENATLVSARAIARPCDILICRWLFPLAGNGT